MTALDLEDFAIMALTAVERVLYGFLRGMAYGSGGALGVLLTARALGVVV